MKTFIGISALLWSLAGTAAQFDGFTWGDQAPVDHTENTQTVVQDTQDDTHDAADHDDDVTSDAGAFSSPPVATSLSQDAQIDHDMHVLKLQYQALQQQLAQTQQSLQALQQDRQSLVRAYENLAHQVRVLQAQRSTNTKQAVVLPKMTSDLQLQQWYTQGFSALKHKHYAAAAKLFQLIIAQGGQREVVGEAYYWHGQIAILQEKYALAQRDFKTLLKIFPDHHKAADAWLKLAMVEAQLGHHHRAIQQLKKVIAEYPDSAASQLAQQTLNRYG